MKSMRSRRAYEEASLVRVNSLGDYAFIEKAVASQSTAINFAEKPVNHPAQGADDLKSPVEPTDLCFCKGVLDQMAAVSRGQPNFGT